MRAISLWQPWASLWLTDRKVHETRHWDTKFRGLLLVHAARTREGLGSHECAYEVERAKLCGMLPLGYFIGVVNLIGTGMIGAGVGKIQPRHDADLACGNWAAGRYAWERRDICKFEFPIAARGRQGFWNVDDAELIRLLDVGDALKLCRLRDAQ